MPGSSKPFRRIMVAIGGSPDKFRAMVVPKWVETRSSYICSLAMLYITAAACLIQFNRWLLAPQRFPFPDVLCITQQALITCAAWGVFFVKQSWFPAAEVLWNEKGLASLMEGRFVALGMVITFSTVCMAIAYSVCSRSVVSMAEDCNLVMMLLITVLSGMEWMPCITALNVTVVFAGGLLVSFTFSPIHFTLLGLGAVIAGQALFSSCVLGQDIMMTRQRPGVIQCDPRSLLLFTTPASLFTAFALFLPFHLGRNDLEHFITPLVWYWPSLVVNAVLTLVVSGTALYIIKYCGAVGFLLVGMLSRILIAGATSLSVHGVHLIFHSHYGHLQLYGTLLAMSGISHYALIQSNIDSFEAGSKLHRFVCAYRRVFKYVGCVLEARKEREYSYSTDESEVSERQYLVDDA